VRKVRVCISPELFVEILTTGDHPGGFRVEDGLPASAKCVGVEAQGRDLVFYFADASFPEVSEGELPTQIEPRFTKLYPPTEGSVGQ
jgi:hypothetical protein